MRRLWTEGFHVHLQLLGFFEEQYRQEVDRLDFRRHDRIFRLSKRTVAVLPKLQTA